MQKIRYISLSSGIEAWSCAVAGMPEYEAVAFSEIDTFACAVLKHHYPDVPNLGDITKVDWEAYHGLADIIVGGSPCQGFSQAGYRKGLRDARSSLALAYVQAIEHVQPRWLLWENVPGVLSTNDGEDFRAFLAALDDLGFGLAWAVLDSQWFGVAQRRRRVFVVGHLGSWEPAAQVLFERSCLQRNPPPRRKAGQGDSCGAEAGAGNGRLAGCGQPNELAPSLTSSGAAFARTGQHGTEVDVLVLDSPAYAVRTARTGANGIGIAEESAHTLDGAGVQAVAVERERDGSLRNGGSPAVAGRQGDELDHRREAHRSTASGKDTFPTLCANCGDKLWLGNQEAFSGDYFIKEPR
jgi:DNA (cytosine-5)-methyltransferase 1